MILKLTNNKNTYSFEVEDLNNGEKLFYHFEIPTADMEDGNYKMVLLDGDEIITEEQVCIGAYNPQAIQYSRGENVYINAPFEVNLEEVKEVEITSIETTVLPSEGYDGIKAVEVNAQPIYDEGYNVGNAEGIEVGKAEQKAMLEPITITENGTYENENGYSTIEVNVPDTNGSYDEGYTDGYAEGEAKGVENAGSIIAETARVLNITENGYYMSRYSEPPTPDAITGVYPDGTEFYNYAKLYDKIFNTNITATPTTRLELWYKGDNAQKGDGYNLIIGAGKKDDSNCYQLRYGGSSNTQIWVAVGYSELKYTWDENAWHHILIAKETEDASFMSLWIDEVKIGDFGNTSFNPQSTFYINGIEYALNWQRRANGCFGMIKIDDTIIIPTAEGFLNTNTGELLEVAEEGNYVFTDNTPPIPEGNLIKTVNVNVVPKINLAENGIKFGRSTFTEVPDFYDFSNITDMSYMFTSCTNLTKLPNGINGKIVDKWSGFMSDTAITSIEPIDTSLCANLDYMFQKTKLTTIPELDTSNATTMRAFFGDTYITTMPELDTRKVKDMFQFFYVFGGNKNLVSLPKIYCDSCTNMGQYFSYYADGMSNLTEVGGWINLKCNWSDRYGLPSCNNLTYQSCINVLNGLYDFTSNGETPNSEQGQLKVHQNFLDTVGDEISIGTNKGWIITA